MTATDKPRVQCEYCYRIGTRGFTVTLDRKIRCTSIGTCRARMNYNAAKTDRWIKAYKEQRKRFPVYHG